ncbi:class I SAM-dependent methyltransferase [Brumimicrobium glaciale]|jgi:SAM-dependent methyltransferase|uniref:Class I SAM-dependent methyltransferase n=1 Tax=Brumimicrobium glaciale TaxID=200475 RepID=A0A4Q4KD64_9FLAO|nr:class I SAM-dependent methyltransferase [Brumimicrobium glaciale]RYM30805.1 class I SAM-dependent methyltransferase [Brumimicrobium glaciale]
MDKKDPIGKAIWDYHTHNSPEDIVVESDLIDDDFLPIDHLMRNFDDFPKLEIAAMEHCTGRILDVGAAAGPHARYLLEKGHDVTTLEVSPTALRYLEEVFPKATHYSTPILDFNTGEYDTILLLMNGIGLAGTFNEVTPFLKHVASLLAPGGSILCDSTDVQNVFEDEEGALWVDLNANYYGEFKFNMKYKDSESGWFNWVYVDVKNLEKFANEAGLDLTLLEDDENSFLVQLKKQL